LQGLLEVVQIAPDLFIISLSGVIGTFDSIDENLDAGYVFSNRDSTVDWQDALNDDRGLLPRVGMIPFPSLIPELSKPNRPNGNYGLRCLRLTNRGHYSTRSLPPP
jgi:hypothetical protein